jgi:hypothetical protein
MSHGEHLKVHLLLQAQLKVSALKLFGKLGLPILLKDSPLTFWHS